MQCTLEKISGALPNAEDCRPKWFKDIKPGWEYLPFNGMVPMRSTNFRVM